MENLTIIDGEYKQWVKTLALRYRQSQIKAAVKVNTEQLLFNLCLGKEITDRQAENRYGARFYDNLSKDLKEELPGVEGLSASNIRYCKRFYNLYSEAIKNLPQVVEKLENGNYRTSSLSPPSLLPPKSLPAPSFSTIANKCCCVGFATFSSLL